MVTLGTRLLSCLVIFQNLITFSQLNCARKHVDYDKFHYGHILYVNVCVCVSLYNVIWFLKIFSTFTYRIWKHQKLYGDKSFFSRKIKRADKCTSLWYTKSFRETFETITLDKELYNVIDGSINKLNYLLTNANENSYLYLNLVWKRPPEIYEIKL